MLSIKQFLLNYRKYLVVFAKKENARIYCKEYIHEENIKEKKVVMLYLYYKKEMKSKRLKALIENLGGYEYEFSDE